MSDPRDVEAVRASLRAMGLEHAVTDDEIHFIIDHPLEAIEQARQMAKASNEMSETLTGYWQRIWEQADQS